MTLALPKLTPIELQIMDVLWTHGASAVRQVQEEFPEDSRPAYTTLQTVLYRLEGKKVVRRTRKIGNAHLFEAIVDRASVQRRALDDVLRLFGGQAQPMMAHLVESGRLTMDDVREVERLIQDLENKGTP
jgi:predicted transcriptional regulator